jgi:hypothetical protein
VKHYLFLRIVQARPAYRRLKAIQFWCHLGRMVVYPLNAVRYICIGYGKLGLGLL